MKVELHQRCALNGSGFDVLDAPDALYIDGNVSRFYAPQIGRTDVGLPMGPILGVAVPAD